MTASAVPASCLLLKKILPLSGQRIFITVPVLFFLQLAFSFSANSHAMEIVYNFIPLRYKIITAQTPAVCHLALFSKKRKIITLYFKSSGNRL
jgi:hypothetical protein